jgi:amidase
MTDWTDTSLCAVADAIATGKVTSREILESCLDRTRRLNPLLNAFVDYDLDGAIAAADRADKALKRG